MKTSEIHIEVGEGLLIKGDLAIPQNPEALVIFSHGSGSSRFSPRNRFVAEKLNEGKVATLLIDLLTEKEDRSYQNRFNIALITQRLESVTNFVTKLSDLKDLKVGLFGASTGAASALNVAANLPQAISAVVSRGGRPDLASSLEKVKAPTLLIVGGLDGDVISLNRASYSRLKCEKDLKIIQGAGHLFEEPSKLGEVADLALSWFSKYLVSEHSVIIK